MKRLITYFFLLLLAAPAFASTHKFPYDTPCNELWRAIKDTLKTSGKYGIIAIDNTEMTASYNIGGNLTGKRINSAILAPAGQGCELQIQTAYSGLVNNDAGDMKKRIDESLAKLKQTPLPAPEAAPAPAAKPDAAAQTSIAVDSTPAGADIEIDGNFVGSTPSTVNVPSGVHEVVVKKKGFADWKRKMNVTGGVLRLNAELETSPAH